jgi:lipopolysaccharide transport system ATP-binding protein
MSDVVIRAEGLGKKYLIGHQSQDGYQTLRDVVARHTRGLARSVRDIAKGRPNVAGDEIEEFWALRDVDFEIRRGDAVGIVGRNGAGKSTLLKVLSRITEPTLGRITIKGRVASLLEVGTGFHPELTGRENVFLNGAILGMTRREIRRKFDEIVAFAEIERFLDTPVKRYSSGMYVRLAFAVAAHLEPEILIVDEVLAVGDAEFQRKCMGKMQDVAKGGRTVILVSHNVSAIRRLCSSAILMKAGRVDVAADVDTVLAYAACEREGTGATWSFEPRYENPFFTPHSLVWDGSTIRIAGRVGEVRHNLTLALRISNDSMETIFITANRDEAGSQPFRPGTSIDITLSMPSQILRPGAYRAELQVFLHNETYIIGPDDGPAIWMAMPPSDRASEYYEGKREGIVGPVIAWATTEATQ